MGFLGEFGFKNSGSVERLDRNHHFTLTGSFSPDHPVSREERTAIMLGRILAKIIAVNHVKNRSQPSSHQWPNQLLTKLGRLRSAP
jgi:hypothetical protein